MRKKTGKKIGRKGKYCPEILKKIYDLKKTGKYTLASICESVGITYETYYQWLETKNEFSELIKRADEEAEQSLLFLAKTSLVKKIEGYEIEEVTTEKHVNPLTKKLTLTNEKIVKKHVAPSDAAIIFTLKNLDPEKFKDRVEHSGTITNKNIDINATLKNLTDEQLKVLDDISRNIVAE